MPPNPNRIHASAVKIGAWADKAIQQIHSHDSQEEFTHEAKDAVTKKIEHVKSLAQAIQKESLKK